MARALRPDLILVDIKMPQTDGSQAAETFLEDAETKSISIVFITGPTRRKGTGRRKWRDGRSSRSRPAG